MYGAQTMGRSRGASKAGRNKNRQGGGAKFGPDKAFEKWRETLKKINQLDEKNGKTNHFFQVCAFFSSRGINVKELHKKCQAISSAGKIQKAQLGKTMGDILRP